MTPVLRAPPRTSACSASGGSTHTKRAMRHDDELTDVILREAIAIHRDLGPGLFELVYELVLADALERVGLCVERQVTVPVRYRGRTIAAGYRIDLLVENRVVVECKSLAKLREADTQQVLTHLRLGGFTIGLLLNFGAARLVDGVKRFVNKHQPTGGSVLRINREPQDGKARPIA